MPFEAKLIAGIILAVAFVVTVYQLAKLGTPRGSTAKKSGRESETCRASDRVADESLGTPSAQPTTPPQRNSTSSTPASTNTTDGSEKRKRNRRRGKSGPGNKHSNNQPQESAGVDVEKSPHQQEA